MAQLLSEARGEAGGAPSAGASWERPDPAGVVRRGSAAEHVRFGREAGEGPVLCCVGGRSAGACGREAVMEVYGLEMCERHGEEAAALALEEIAFDLEQERERLLNPAVRSLSPHLEAAFERADGVLADEAHDSDAHEAALLAAFPLDRSRVDPETLAYVADPERDELGRLTHEPPYDLYMDERVALARHMRLAFEEGATWIVETLEPLRASASEQCAYALALEAEAGLRDGVPDEAGGGAE